MKTNTKKKGNPAKKLIPAAGSLMVSAVMLATSTYAWFTMNKEVEVTGMQMKTKVSGNLLICYDNLEASYSPDTLSEGRKALLEPVSSINGKTDTFFYTIDATARGTKAHSTSDIPYVQYSEDTSLANAVAGKQKYDDDFNGSSQYKVLTSGATTDEFGTAYGYIDYVFYLKGTSDAVGDELRLTECNLLRDDAAISSSGTVGHNVDRAWRVAVWAQDITENGGLGTGTVGSIDAANTGTLTTGILALDGATYFTPTQAVKDGTDLDAVNTVTTEASAKTTATTGAVLDQFTAANATKYYKVTVRVWLEGEDDTCNSETYAALENGLWKFNCKFELGTDTAAVTKINSDTAKVASSGTTQTPSGSWNDPTA